MSLDTRALDGATDHLEPLEFADGSMWAVRPFTIKMFRKWEALQAHETIDGLVELLRDCCPEASLEAIDALTPARVAIILAHARGALQQALAALEKNGGGGPGVGTATPAPPSSLTTSSTPSSPASGASRAATGSTGTTVRRAGRSSTPPTG